MKNILICNSVLGAAEYQQKAPPKSYINVLDYESPKELAEFLLELAADEEEYLSYFWWKVGASSELSDPASVGIVFQRYYQVHTDERERAGKAMCKLCEKLNESPLPVKSYPSLGTWWWASAHCTRKGHVPWARPRSSWSSDILQFFPRG